jgi:hypothetical protein
MKEGYVEIHLAVEVQLLAIFSMAGNVVSRSPRRTPDAGY